MKYFLSQPHGRPAVAGDLYHFDALHEAVRHAVYERRLAFDCPEKLDRAITSALRFIARYEELSKPVRSTHALTDVQLYWVLEGLQRALCSSAERGNERTIAHAAMQQVFCELEAMR